MKSISLAILLLFSSFPGYAETSKKAILRMATTTSTDNTGLLKTILPAFEAHSGFQVQVVAVGTGKALKMGRDGDVDVILVHARAAEEEFVAKGYGTKRHDVMYNQFLLVGSESDPAGIKSAGSATEALSLIANKQSRFISRGDDSGTHKKEQSLWETADINPNGKWYMEAGQGMGKIIQIASELDAYTLTDSGTWLVYKQKSPLKVLYSGDKELFNPYGIIAVNAELHNDTNHEGATALINWITSKHGQMMIGDFQFHGEQLFVPNSQNTEDGS